VGTNLFQLGTPSIVTRNQLTMGDYCRSCPGVGVGVGVGVGGGVGVGLPNRICTDAMQSEVENRSLGRCFAAQL
jgi:hypothetical protein